MTETMREMIERRSKRLVAEWVEAGHSELRNSATEEYLQMQIVMRAMVELGKTYDKIFPGITALVQLELFRVESPSDT